MKIEEIKITIQLKADYLFHHHASKMCDSL